MKQAAAIRFALLLGCFAVLRSHATGFYDDFETGEAFTTGGGSQAIANGWWSSGLQSKAYNSTNNLGVSFVGTLGWSQDLAESNFDSLAVEFNPVALSYVGDAITLSFDYSTSGTIDNSIGLRVRLYKAGGGLYDGGAFGYGLHIPSGSDTSPLFYQEVVDVKPLNSGTGIVPAVSGGTAYGDGNAAVAFTVTKSGNDEITLSGSHGLHTFSAVVATTNLTEFDSLAFSTGSIAHGLQVDDVRVESTLVDTNNRYAVWAAGHGLLGAATNAALDFDGDGMANYVEYALGGGPAAPDAESIKPVAELDSNGMDYAYRRRTDDRKVVYAVEACTNLVSGGWCALGIAETGAVPDGVFESVTNRIPMLGKDQQFVRLRIRNAVEPAGIGFDTPHEWVCDYRSEALETVVVSNVAGVVAAVDAVTPGQAVVLMDGVYSNLSLVVRRSGRYGAPVVIRADNPGQAIISGDSFVEIDADHVVLAGLYFKDGTRNTNQWGTHAEGLITIYGSRNRITDCAIHQFDEAHGAWIVSLLKDGVTVPQYNRIDHCSFTEKITFDQVINLNNIVKQSSGDPHALETPPIYSRIDHCYFSNPPKPGNAGGGIRIGYYRNSLGRCLIDSNVFERQDSEAEIITSKSQQNLYYNNTYKNCRGTMNFRHGDGQMLIGSYLYSTDTMHEYGGAFLWGSGHVVANNYFSFARTLGSRGNAALYLNSGIDESEHSTCFSNVFARNIFADNNGYDVDCEGLLDRRIAWAADCGESVAVTRDNRWLNNVFRRDPAYSAYPIFRRVQSSAANDSFSDNIASNANQTLPSGVSVADPGLVENAHGIKLPSDSDLTALNPGELVVDNIVGIDVDINELVNRALTGDPLQFEDVGPSWLTEKPGTYAETGVLAPDVQARLNAITQ